MKSRRRRLRLGVPITVCVVLAAGYQAWRAGLLPIEIADAETGFLVSSTPPTETANSESAFSDPVLGDSTAFLSGQGEPADDERIETEGTRYQASRSSALAKATGQQNMKQTESRVSIFRRNRPPRQTTGLSLEEGSADSGIQQIGFQQEAPSSDEKKTARQTRPRSTASIGQSPEPADPALLKRVDELIEQGQDVAAHRELSRVYWQFPGQRLAIQDRIERTARSIYLSPQPHFIEPYEVQAGDQLGLIAKRYEVPWEYLAKLNRVDPRKIRAGQKLKVIKGPFAAVVDLSEFRLTVHAHGYYVHSYPVGIGRDGTSPIGRFRVQEKLVNPTYYGPDGVIAADHPENPLGEYWLGIGDSYGIHGTIDPDSIGKAESKGCIRLNAEDVAEVFQLLSAGSEVIIRR